MPSPENLDSSLDLAAAGDVPADLGAIDTKGFEAELKKALQAEGVDADVKMAQ